MSERPHVCPECARTYARSERFCEDCRMPLVLAPGAEPVSTERRRTARKIKPEYAEGPLVKVARVETQPEAEFVAGLLLEEGIPCLLKGVISGYSPSLDIRDILVPESGAQAAREVLAPRPEA